MTLDEIKRSIDEADCAIIQTKEKLEQQIQVRNELVEQFRLKAGHALNLVSAVEVSGNQSKFQEEADHECG